MTGSRSYILWPKQPPLPFHVPIRKPPPEPPAANVNRITAAAQLDPLTTDVDPEYLDSIAPELPIAFNMAAFVDGCPTLQQLVQLGVDLSVVEKDPEVGKSLLRMNFDRHIKPHIQALMDIGVPAEELGPLITENPYIFQVSIHNIKARVEYLLSKDFPPECIVRIVTGYPPYLNYSVKQVDARLGYLQNEFYFNADGLRTVLINHPQLMGLETEDIRTIKCAIFDLMAFEYNWTRLLILQLPAILSQPPKKLVNIFDILHNTGNINHGLMIRFPEVFVTDERQVSDRIGYLMLLGRDQYDPSRPLYVPLTAISSVSDAVFATKYARTSEADYDLYLKNR